MKNVFYFFLSLILHLSLGFVLWKKGESFALVQAEVPVDLTVYQPKYGSTGNSRRSGSAQSKKTTVSVPESTQNTPNVSERTDNQEEDHGQGIPGQPNASSGPVAWGELSKLPKVAKEFKAVYPTEAKKAGIDGPVILDVIIDPQGKVQEVLVISGPGYGLNESAVAALKRFEFIPAQKGAESVSVKIRYTYRFKLGVN